MSDTYFLYLLFIYVFLFIQVNVDFLGKVWRKGRSGRHQAIHLDVYWVENRPKIRWFEVSSSER